MNVHAQFAKYLQAQPDSDRLWKAYSDYKSSPDGYAFALNGWLKSGAGQDDVWSEQVSLLKRTICACSDREFQILRMTSVEEFYGPLDSIKLGETIIYKAFMSATGNAGVLANFVPGLGKPLLLKIGCPPGTAVALMEGTDCNDEDEYLLGCDTSFEVRDFGHVRDKEELDCILGYGHRRMELRYIELSVSDNPQYTAKYEFFRF